MRARSWMAGAATRPACSRRCSRVSATMPGSAAPPSILWCRQRAALKQREPKEPSSQQGSQIPVGPNSGQPEKQEGELPVGLNLDQRGKPEENELRSPQGSEIPLDVNSGHPEKQRNICRSAQQAAELMKVSRNSVNTANRVQKQGVPRRRRGGRQGFGLRTERSNLPDSTEAKQSHPLIATKESIIFCRATRRPSNAWAGPRKLAGA